MTQRRLLLNIRVYSWHLQYGSFWPWERLFDGRWHPTLKQNPHHIPGGEFRSELAYGPPTPSGAWPFVPRPEWRPFVVYSILGRAA